MMATDDTQETGPQVYINDPPGRPAQHHHLYARTSGFSAATTVSSVSPSPKGTSQLIDHPYLVFAILFVLALVCGAGLMRALLASRFQRLRHLNTRVLRQLRHQRDDARALLNGTARPAATRAWWITEEVD